MSRPRLLEIDDFHVPYGQRLAEKLATDPGEARRAIGSHQSQLVASLR